MNPWEMDWSGNAQVPSAQPQEPGSPLQPLIDLAHKQAAEAMAAPSPHAATPAPTLATGATAQEPHTVPPWQMQWGAQGGSDVSRESPAQPASGNGGIFRNLAAGAVEGVTGAAGFLADAGRALAEQDSGYSMFRDTDAVRPPLGQPQHFLNEQVGKIGFNPEDVPADTTAERLTRAAGAGATSALIPGGGGLFAKLGAGALTGMGGEAAAEVAPEALKPAARVIGGAATGAAGAVTRSLPAAARAAAGAADRAMGPLTQGGRDAVVGERLARSATDPAAVRKSLDKPTELVPGSKPTTFQQTGDMGLGALERETQTKNPEQFQQRRAEQNTARRESLGKLQPTGNAANLASYVKDRLRWLDQQTEQDVADATRVAQERAQRLGGDRTPEDYGATLREPLQDARDAAKARERALWTAIDPNGDLTVNAGPVRLEANSVLAGIARSAKQPTGDEMHILQAASEYGTAIPFSELGALRTSVNDAMRAELRSAGQSQVYGRLSRMRSAVERSINAAVERQAESDPQGLQQGLASWEDRLRRDAGEWRSGASVSRDTVANESGRAGDVSAIPGGQVPPRGRPGVPSGGAGVQSAPTFDEAAAQRLRVASQATRERADTFDRGPVGQTLAKAGRQDQYKLSDASVGLKVFQPGPRGAESVAAYRRAVGDDQALANLQDYAASSLRRAASAADGTLDPRRVDAWLNRHADAMRAFPDLQERFRDARAASEALGEASDSRRALLSTAQSGALGKLAGLDNPEDVTRTVGAIFGAKDGATQMRELARTVGRNPDAREGLRKAVADHIGQRLISNTEAGTSGEAAIKSDQFQTFVRKNRPVLTEVFSPEEVGSLEAIAADLQRSNRSLNAVKIPGQSNTAQDVLARKSGPPSVLRTIVSDVTTAGAAAVGAAVSGFSGAAVGVVGAKTIAALRDAGIKRTDDLLREAMLNPALAKTLMSKVPANPGPSFHNILATRVRNALARGAAAGAAGAAVGNGDGTRGKPMRVTEPAHLKMDGAGSAKLQFVPPNTYDEQEIAKQGAAVRSKGVNPDGSVPGHKPTLDPATAGENWTTISASEDGNSLVFVVPKNPKFDAYIAAHKEQIDNEELPHPYLEDLKKTHRQYGVYETEQAAADAMRAAFMQRAAPKLGLRARR